MNRVYLFISVLLGLFLHCALLSGQDFYLSNTNRAPVQENMRELFFDVTLATFIFEDFSSATYNNSKDPANNLQFRLGYKHYFASMWGASAEVIRQDEYGVGMRLLCLGRAVTYQTKEHSLLFGAGTVLVRRSGLNDSFKPLFSWFFQFGDPLSSFLSIDVDGFFLFPTSPGYLLAKNNQFVLKGQLRFGGLGIYSEFSSLTREEDGTSPVVQYLTVGVKFGVAIFSEHKWRLLMYARIRQKGLYRFLPSMDGHSKFLDQYREAVSLGVDFTGRYRDRDGYLRSYSWGTEFVFKQRLESDAAGTLWESSELELIFFWRSRFSL